MSQLLLINPKVKPSLRKKRTPAQRAATRKLVALNKQRRAGVSKPQSKGVKTVAKKKRSAAQRAATRKLVAMNKSKKSVHKVKRKSKRKSNPVRGLTSHRVHSVARRHKRRRHNPIVSKLGLGGIADLGIKSAIAAGGALTLDLAFGYLPIPDSIKQGPMRHVVKGVGAIALGMLAGMVISKDKANSLATGAMTVVMYNAAREALTNVAPQIMLGEYMTIEQPQLSEYLSGDDAHQEGFDGLMTQENDYSMSGSGFDF